MRKHEELYDPSSCFNKAKAGEMIFVLLSRDEAAPETIRLWVCARIRLGLNQPGDEKIVKALECARVMEEERELIINGLGTKDITFTIKTKNPDGESGSLPDDSDG